jgi:uncharacterized surface anchored protein
MLLVDGAMDGADVDDSLRVKRHTFDDHEGAQRGEQNSSDNQKSHARSP